MEITFNNLWQYLRTRPVWQWLFALLIVGCGWWFVAPQSFVSAWLSHNQQAQIHFNAGEYDSAQRLYDDPQWQAHSAYLAGDFASAASILETRQDLHSQFLLANVYAYSGQLQQAQELYQQLQSVDKYKAVATQNIEVIKAAIEQIKNAPPQKQESEKVIDDRNIVGEESEQEADNKIQISDTVWLKQVRQNPSKFLRQKFQQEYAHEQE
ncbi:tetratricopeptide repeat protein [Vibrio gallicus]|uniref:hypothetical protein n=1 Tax=Vibrio gallicus TaxID=190897 RepID=UPI0021C3B99B|nr:hypothetical protein [Vibrio gallicus]